MRSLLFPVPLTIAISIGLLFLSRPVEAIYVLSFWISGNIETLAPGWSSLMFMLLVVGGSLMIILGISVSTSVISSRK